MSYGPLTIGALVLGSNLALAPMSGITDSALRRLLRRENSEALGLVMTELISVEGVVRNNIRSLALMRFRAEESPLGIQIFGHDEVKMVEAAKIAEQAGADLIDVNAGCPVPKVVRRGAGCGLMTQPTKLASILLSIRRAITVPLTLKIRSGWNRDSVNAREIALLAEESGVDMVTVHARTREQLYRGEADWELIRSVAEAVSIPVMGCGDVMGFASARERWRAPIAGLMIGRGALANPWVFSEIKAGFEGSLRPAGGWKEVSDLLEHYVDMALEELPEKAVIGRAKQLTAQLVRAQRGASEIRGRVCRSRTLVELRENIRQCGQALEMCDLETG